MNEYMLNTNVSLFDRMQSGVSLQRDVAAKNLPRMAHDRPFVAGGEDCESQSRLDDQHDEQSRRGQGEEGEVVCLLERTVLCGVWFLIHMNITSQEW